MPAGGGPDDDFLVNDTISAVTGGCVRPHTPSIYWSTHSHESFLKSAVEFTLDAPEHQVDISNYVRQAASRLREEHELDAGTESQIVNAVSARAISRYKGQVVVTQRIISLGMFLFAKLVMEYLLNQVTTSELLHEIEPSVLPQGLDDA